MKKYAVRTEVTESGEPTVVSFPYGPDASKVRTLSEKRFRWAGEAGKAGLFGQDVFAPGGKAVTLHEGEFDALAGYAMTGCPSLSIKSASTAERDCGEQFKYLDSFDHIYICFDNDPPGQEAVRKVAKLFNPGKVYHMKMHHHKDANEYLVNNHTGEFKQLWANSKLYLPEGIIGSYSEIEDILRSEGQAKIADYPFAHLNGMTLGIRSSEVTLLTAQEGIGKTEIVRALEHHLLKTTDYNMGIIHLEEKEKRSVQGLIGYEVGHPVHFPDSPVSVEDQIEAYRSLTRRDGRVYLYPHFGSDDPNVILDTIRYLAAACQCKFIFLDHITMVVTGFEGEDERRKLDYLSTRLAMLVKELDFTLFLVSHVNDNGQTRGSRNISKIADLSVHLDRDLESSVEEVRNRTKLLVKKNRFGAQTGPAGALQFDPTTFKVKEETLHIEGNEYDF
jgi:twinkle protein